MHRDLFSPCSVDNDILRHIRQLLKRRVKRKVVLLAKRLQNGVGKAAFVRAGLPPHNRDCTLIDAEAPVRNNQVNIKLHLITQPETLGAGAKRIVERKTPRLHLVNADITVRAGKAVGKVHHLAVNDIHHQKPVGKCHDIFDGVCQSPLDAILNRNSVHDDFDIVLDIFLKLDVLGQIIQAAVNAHAHVTALLCAVKHFGMLALSAAHDRRQELKPGALRQLHNLVYHLVNGLALDFPATVRAVRDSNPCI